MATGILDYRAKAGGEKEITLPSGAIFKIRKLTGRDFLQQGNFPIVSTKEIAQAKKDASSTWLKMTNEQQREQMATLNRIIVLAVKEPKLSLIKEEGKLGIDELLDIDYYFLIQAITDFSIGGQELKSFRNGTTPPDAGRDGTTMGSDASSNTG